MFLIRKKNSYHEELVHELEHPGAANKWNGPVGVRAGLVGAKRCGVGGVRLRDVFWPVCEHGGPIMHKFCC